MHVNKVSHVKTVDRVAKELGEDVDWLHEVYPSGGGRLFKNGKSVMLRS